MNEVYIDKDYFKFLDGLIYSINKIDILSNDRSRITILIQIINLLSTLNINTNLSYEEVDSIRNRNIDDSITDRFLFMAMKDETNRLKIGKDLTQIKDFNAFYFLNSSYKNISKTKNGVALLNEHFKGDEFYGQCNIENYTFSGDVNELKTLIPPTNAMIICDNYFFENYKKRKKSISDFVKLFKAGVSSIPFELTIFSKLEDKRNIIVDAMKEICEIGNMQIQIFEAGRDQKYRDRKIYTNYTSISIGHPFDSKETYFTQNFLAVDNDRQRIREINFKKFIMHLMELKSLVNSSRSFLITSNGERELIKYETNDFTNRLFGMIPPSE